MPYENNRSSLDKHATDLVHISIDCLWQWQSFNVSTRSVTCILRSFLWGMSAISHIVNVEANTRIWPYLCIYTTNKKNKVTFFFNFKSFQKCAYFLYFAHGLRYGQFLNFIKVTQRDQNRKPKNENCEKFWPDWAKLLFIWVYGALKL